MSNPLISVIVPIYQIERYLGICIESIINQTYKNLEIILVDDGSPDKCPEICDLYATKDNRIKVIHKLNGGLVSARKVGIESSNGEYIGYVDGDDWIDKDFYEILYSIISSNDCDMVCAGQSRDLFDKSEKILNSYPVGIYSGDELKELYQNMLSYNDFYKPGITTYVWNKLFKREIVYKKQMCIDERISIGEDAAVIYPALMDCKKVYISDCTSYHYRQREDSMLKKSSDFKTEATKLRYLYEYMSLFAGNYGLSLQRQVNDYISGLCIIRSGGILDNEHSTFGKTFKDRNIAVYSAGTFGQQFVRRIKETEYCNIVKWIDDDYWEYRRCCLDVDPVQSIRDLEFDYIVVASIDSCTVAKVKKRLFEYGINESKILIVNCSEKIRKDLIRGYLY